MIAERCSKAQELGFFDEVPQRERVSRGELRYIKKSEFTEEEWDIILKLPLEPMIVDILRILRERGNAANEADLGFPPSAPVSLPSLNYRFRSLDLRLRFSRVDEWTGKRIIPSYMKLYGLCLMRRETEPS